MMKKYKIILIVLTSIFILNILFNIVQNYKEKQVLNAIVKNVNLITHKDINDFKRKIIKEYINPPKSKQQMNLWVKNRGLLRQTVLETLNGKAALCGELSRVMIGLLRSKGIKSRRLYVYGTEGTAHVMLEYYNKNLGKWIVLNSYKSTKYLEDFTQKAYTPQELFEKADAKKLVYTHFSNLNYQLVKLFGYKYDISYLFSYIMDEIYLLKILFNTFLLLLSLLIWRKIK